MGGGLPDCLLCPSDVAGMAGAVLGNVLVALAGPASVAGWRMEAVAPCLERALPGLEAGGLGVEFCIAHTGWITNFGVEPSAAA